MKHRRVSITPARKRAGAVALGLALVGGAVGAGYGGVFDRLLPDTDPVSTDRTAEHASRGNARTGTSGSPSAPAPASVSVSPSTVAAPPPVNLSSPQATSPSTAAPTTSRQPLPPAPADCLVYAGNRRTGCTLLSSYGFGLDQMPALDKLWAKESGWNHLAENSSSGAYGIPQALPGSKMGSVASDWRTNPATQIRWGLGYIKGRYGTPAGAWSFWQSNGWY